MNPFPYNHIAAYRMDQLKGQATTKRMANAAKAKAIHRNADRFPK